MNATKYQMQTSQTQKLDGYGIFLKEQVTLASNEKLPLSLKLLVSTKLILFSLFLYF